MKSDLIPSKSFCKETKRLVQLSVLRDGDTISILIDGRYKIEFQYLINFLLPSLEQNLEGIYEVEEVIGG